MNSSRLHRLWRQTSSQRAHATRRAYSSRSSAPENAGSTRHAQFYSDLLPGMVPVALLGSAIYLGLRLLQASLSQEKFMDRAEERVKDLQEEVDALHRASVSMQKEESITETAENYKSRWWLW